MATCKLLGIDPFAYLSDLFGPHRCPPQRPECQVASRPLARSTINQPVPTISRLALSSTCFALTYLPGRTRFAKGHAYGWYFRVFVPPCVACTLAASLNGERLVSETMVGLIRATKASRPPAFAG